jgi:hypothetical protein
MSTAAIELIDHARIVYIWIATTDHDGKYVEVDPDWMKRLVKDEFEGHIDYTFDHLTNEMYFH